MSLKRMECSRKIVDIHTHVLPGVDDGAESIEEAKALIRLAREQGVIGVVATPHYSRRRTHTGLEQLTEAVTREIQKECPGFCVFLGQETYYHENLVERLRSGEALTLAGGSYVLVEFPEGIDYIQLFQGLRRIRLAGYQPVVAHVERYRCLRKKGLDELIGLGCLNQMNFDSLCGRWYQPDTRWCRKQIREKKIHVLATDMHRLKRRPPRIDEAWRWLERNVSQEELARMTYETPVRIIGREDKGL